MKALSRGEDMGLTFRKFRNGLERYLVLCEEKGELPVWSGLCNYLGVLEEELEVLCSRDELLDREVRLARQRILEYLEREGLSGKVNSQVLKFVLANRYGWKNEREFSSKGNIGNKLKKLVEKAERTL